MGLAFVAVGALLGIKLISGHAEDIIALHADTVNVILCLLGGLRSDLRRATGLIGSAAHGGILPRSTNPGPYACGLEK